MVPDRLSYTEMYYEGFKYPSVWTESFEAYEAYRPELCGKIIEHMTYYHQQLSQLRKQAQDLSKYFFSATTLLEMIK